MSPEYQKIKDTVLGKRYDLSLVFVSVPQMRKAMKFRYTKISGKKTSNVLSFPLSKTSGEILICKAAAKPYSVEYLFIHGLFHLQGLQHGATMERNERQILTRFGLRMHEQHRHRNRHRDVPR